MEQIQIHVSIRVLYRSPIKQSVNALMSIKSNYNALHQVAMSTSLIAEGNIKLNKASNRRTKSLGRNDACAKQYRKHN